MLPRLLLDDQGNPTITPARSIGSVDESYQGSKTCEHSVDTMAPLQCQCPQMEKSFFLHSWPSNLGDQEA